MNLGYIYDEKAIEKFLSENPMVFKAGPLKSSEGKEYFHSDVEIKVLGSVRPKVDQKIGDCVSHGYIGAVETVMILDMEDSPGNAFKPLSTEVLYSLARIQIGKGGCSYDDGALVSWAFEAGQQYGHLPRGKYGEYDLTKYNPNLARKWGSPRVGCPAPLAEAAKAKKLLKAELIQDGNKFDQACDAILAGAAIVSGCNVLFGQKRDAQGFSKAFSQGGHCTHFTGFVRTGNRPGIVMTQSWGENMPEGGEARVKLPSGRDWTCPSQMFLIDADAFEKAHRSGSELWALYSADAFLKPDSEVDFVFT
jgi:hypothetical protein